MYKIKRAIILAAGRGSRLRPYTDKVPKPLLPVHGKPIIEHVLDYLISKCITDIIIVVGYRARQFRYLEKKYSGAVTLIRNKMFARGSNLLSLQLVTDKIEDCVILDADTILSGNAIRKCVAHSGYSYVKEKRANEWAIKIDSNNRITHVIPTLSTKYNFNALHSISYWVGDEAIMYRQALKTAKDNVNYVDDIAINLPVTLHAFEIQHDDLLEIDTVEDYENANKD